MCGGCGAKVVADILSGPLSRLPTSERTDIIRLPGDDAALLDFGSSRQVITADSLRSFTHDPYRMSKIAALHAMGDIWAMGALPQAVLVTVTLPPLARPLQAEWLGEIMAGAAEVLLPTGAEIVGGHTSMGAELSLGFSITGTARRSTDHIGRGTTRPEADRDPSSRLRSVVPWRDATHGQRTRHRSAARHARNATGASGRDSVGGWRDRHDRRDRLRTYRSSLRHAP